MEAGSIAVKKGQHVKAGDLLGKIGFSGDALFPHEHYTVTDSAAYPSQGVPSYFRDVSPPRKKRPEAEDYAQIDTGDIVTGDARCGR